MIVNFYRTPTSYTVLNVPDIGEISSGASQYQESFSVIANMDVVVYLNDYIDPDTIGGSVLNFANDSGTAFSLYSTSELQNGFTFDQYINSTTGYLNFSPYLNGSYIGASVIASYENYAMTYRPTRVYLVTATVNGVKRLGFLGINDRDPNSGGFRRWNAFVSNSAWSDKMLSEIRDMKNIDADVTDPIGGDDAGDFDFEGDEIDLPDAPDETVSGVLASGFLNIYTPTASQLQAFGGALWTNAFNTKWYDLDSVSNLILNAVSDPINFIVGLFMLPVTPTNGNSSGIFLGGINVNTVTANRVTEQYVTCDFGTIQIGELYGNYLDYAYSKLSIYLPYIGMADIDVQEVTGGSVTLRYIIDAFTGACVANVKCVKSIKSPWGTVYTNSTVHSYSGNVALQLPISAGSFDIMTQGLINVGLGLVSGQPQTVAKGAQDVIQNVGGDATTRGALSSNTGRLCYQTPYLMFTHPIETRPANLGALHGYSAGVGGKLSQFSGYVECSDVKLDGITATDSEKDMIETLLKSGVYV